MIIDWITKLLFGRKLVPLRVYTNKKDGIVILYDDNEQRLNIFIKGLLLRIPTDMAVDDSTLSLDTINNIFNKTEINTMSEVVNQDLNELKNEELLNLLKYYEEQEDYSKCAEINNILNSRVNE